MHTPAVEDGTARDDVTRFVCTRRAGEIIFTQGEFGAELFIIEEGSVELLTTSADGVLTPRVRLSAGETFGERALLDEQAREITARAVTDCRLLRIDYATLLELIREKPLIGLYLLRRQVRRVRWLAEQTSQQASGPISTQISGETSEEAGQSSAVHAAANVPATPAAAPAPAPLRPRFVHAESGQEFAVPDATATDAMIGRIDRATGLAPELDFSEIDPQRSLSRRHARLTRDGWQFLVTAEPGAGNGTIVNNRRLPPGETVALQDGDRVRFGMVDTIFRCV